MLLLLLLLRCMGVVLVLWLGLLLQPTTSNPSTHLLAGVSLQLSRGGRGHIARLPCRPLRIALLAMHCIYTRHVCGLLLLLLLLLSGAPAGLGGGGV